MKKVQMNRIGTKSNFPSKAQQFELLFFYLLRLFLFSFESYLVNLFINLIEKGELQNKTLFLSPLY